MSSLFAIAILALASPPAEGDATTSRDQNVATIIDKLVTTIERSEESATSELIDAAVVCETLLSTPKDFSPTSGGWVIRYENEGGSVFTRGGVLLMHRLADGDFPESCGIVAVPAESYNRIAQAFSERYNISVNTDESTGSGAPYPISTFSTEKYSYRLKSAERPGSALSIVVGTRNSK